MLAILDPELRRRRPRPRCRPPALVGGLAALALVVGAAAPVARTCRAHRAGAGRGFERCGARACGRQHTDGLPSAPTSTRPMRRRRRSRHRRRSLHQRSAPCPLSTRESLRRASNALTSGPRTSVAPVRRAMRTRQAPSDRSRPDGGARRPARRGAGEDASAATRSARSSSRSPRGDCITTAISRVAVDALVAALTGDANASMSARWPAWSLAEADGDFRGRGALTKALQPGQGFQVSAGLPPGRWARWATRARSMRWRRS